MLKLHRESEKLGGYNKIKSNSFAYRFNRKYRIQNEINKKHVRSRNAFE